MEWLIGLLPLLILLACPLMMVWCMRGMRHRGCSTDARAADTPATRHGQPASLAELESRLASLQSEQAAIAARVAELRTDSAPASQPDVLPNQTGAASRSI